MDMSPFSSEDFDPKDWLNKTFRCPEAEKNKEEYATFVVAKLQANIQEVNVSLEKTAEQVYQNLPRITREIEIMQNEAKLLQQQMINMKGEVMKVEHDSSESMKILLKIDQVKSNMQEASKALREADNWTTLSADVEDVFETGDIHAIASKLVGMQNSLEILSEVADFKERCQRLESLKDRLEAMISPALVASLNSQSLVSDVGLTYTKIFKDIRRLNTLQKHYHNFQKHQLINQWKQIVESDPEESLIDWLNNFHDLLLSAWHSQLMSCQQLFPETPASQILCELFVDVLTNLDPLLSHCLDAALKLTSNPLQSLLGFKQITDRFAKSLELSIQNTEIKSLNGAHTLLLVKTIFAPYHPHIEQYDRLEEQYLVLLLKTLNLQSEEIEDSVRLLGDSVSKVFCLIQEAENRCLQLTQGCGYMNLLRAVEGFLRDYAGSFRRLLRLFETAINPRQNELIDDWSLFHQSLQVTQVMGEILLQMENLETLYVRNMREVGRKLGYYSSAENKSIDPFHAYDDILLSSSAKKELQTMIGILQEGPNVSPLKCSLNTFKKLCFDSGKLISNLVLKQAQVHLEKIPTMELWTEDSSSYVVSDLPEFSLSPQEYITEVGQYLMTIPQHIEPFILRDNPPLHKAMKNCKIPQSGNQDESSNVADYLLECLARRITDCYYDNIIKIHFITSSSTNQLVTDISYFCDVLDDLGLAPSKGLKHLQVLLKTKPELFESIAKDKPKLLVQKIKSMRKL